jgi:integrase
MASLRPRADTGLLFFDFRWEGKRYRAPTELPDTPENRALLAPKLRQLQESIKRGRLNLATFFPELASPSRRRPPKPVASEAPVPTPTVAAAPLAVAAMAAVGITFKAFAETWFVEFKVGWRRTYITTVRGILDQHLLPRFGALAVGAVTRAEIMDFRATLSQLRGRRPGTTLSPARINTVMLILRQILQEAADRYDFAMPMGKLKPLKVPKSHVAPFSLEEAHLLINKVRADYQNYMKVRIFTGMRSGELHGLKWKYIDFERRLILVREAIVAGEEDDTKSESSQRDIQMSQVVFDALKAQHKATGHMTYVFCNRAGEPIDTMNFTKRVWYPLLRHLNLAARRPYQTRHTAATLWLASGETPEWIARQLGHASTEMLFRVYSRFVPNLTRNDGSAFDRLLTARFQPGAPADGGAKGASNGDGDPKAQPPPARRAALAAA